MLKLDDKVRVTEKARKDVYRHYVGKIGKVYKLDDEEGCSVMLDDGMGRYFYFEELEHAD